MIRYIRAATAAQLKGIALLRLDFNAEDEWRLAATMPTVKFLAARADKVVIVSHRGRPSPARGGAAPGKSNRALSLRKDAAMLQRYLKRPVAFIPHFRWRDIAAQIKAAPPRSVFLLENIRFMKGETENDPKLARELASIADYYVNDSFAVDHRADASTVAITRFLSSYAGLELEKEIKFLSGVRRHPRQPLVLVVGGAKAHDKLGVIKEFRRHAAAILVGGGSANTLLHLQGMDVGRSVFDRDKNDLAALKEVLGYRNVFLPVDWKIAQGRILDIGPRTAKMFAGKISAARTVIWSGPMGFIEKKKFAGGNLAVAKAIAGNRRAFSLTGGGETVAFLKEHKLDKKFSFISTGGGAFLDFLAGEKLPGIEALKRAARR
jgi:phosphoglycerate kinase